MSILKQLQNNKGTVSSALGKALAEEVIKGNKQILKEAVELISYDDKNVRAGAAKTIEKVAEKKPELVADYLKNLAVAFEMPEPQTRWMIIHAYGLCANLNFEIAKTAFEKAKLYLKNDDSSCLWDRAIVYLGYIGATSSKQSQRVFPVLKKAFDDVPSQTKTILESFEKMLSILDDKQKDQVLKIA